MDALALDALRHWENSSTNQEALKKRYTRERLVELTIGEDVDRSYNLLGKTIDTKLMLPSAQLSEISDVYTYNTFITDVPGDGDCGYHAIRLAARIYGEATAMGSQYPRSTWETRQYLISFLREQRNNIETALINDIIEKQPMRCAAAVASHIIWRDVGNKRRDGSQPLFEEFCSGITKSGFSGQWMGSLLGEIELHLLARSLGVMLFCVRAAEKDDQVLLRHEGSPFSFLWKGQMFYRPTGAIVIRFTGSYMGGHFQIVNSGMAPKDPDMMTKNRQGIENQSAGTRRKLETMRKVQGDVDTVKYMHGVQMQTKKRYRANMRIIELAFQKLKESGIDPLRLETYGTAVLDTIMTLIMERCGPKSEGYEGLSAKSTGNALLAAVGMWYKNQGFHFSTNICVAKGDSVQGPPWKADQVLQFRSLLQKQQAKSRSNPVKRAYQLTHDDVAEAVRVNVCAQLGEALSQAYPPGKNPNVDWLSLQTTLMVVAAFGSGCRGAEMVSIRLGEVSFLSAAVDTTIGAVLYGTKAKTGEKAVRRIVFPSWKETMIISPSHAILMQMVLIHGLHLGNRSGKHLAECPLFPKIIKNQPQLGQHMKSGAYSASIREVFKALGITDNVTEHSPRRGGSGFRYFVLNEDFPYIRDILGHTNIQETITYVGLNDPKNSYVSQGYSSCNTGEFR